MKEILKKTLEHIPFSFSSNEFCKMAKKNGLTKREVENGVIALFLHRNAVQGETRRMWRKHNGLTSDKSKSDKIMEAIDLLKKNGYKILKQTTDWIEV